MSARYFVVPALFVCAALAMGASPAATSGGFTAMQATTTDPQRFMQEWSRPGAHADLHVETSTERGRPISAFIAFRGCTPDAAGACHVDAELTVVDPAGKRGGAPARFPVWDRAPLPAPQFALAGSAPAIAFDAGDPPGRYVFATTVTDRVSGAKVEVSSTVELRSP